MNKTIIAVSAVVLAVAVGGFVVYNNQKTTSQPATETVVEDSMQASPTSAMEDSASEAAKMQEVKEFTVTGAAFKFNPTEIRVKKGDRVKVTFKSVGGFHDFVVDEYGVATKQLASGQEEVVEFTADKAGTFEFYCSVANHRAMGMKGNLIVE